MLILSLDTSTEKGSIAILENRDVVSALFLSQGKSYSQSLIPSIEFLLQQNSLSLKDMDGFAVSIGPGSFTGIRIGISCIKAFSLALNKKIAPISSLFALAYKLREFRNSFICPVIDAKKGEIFSSLYFLGEDFETIIEEGCYNPPDFFSRLPKEEIYFVGDGCNIWKEEIEKWVRGKPIFLDLDSFLAVEIGKIGYKVFLEGKGKEPYEISPLYYRPSEAELKKKF